MPRRSVALLASLLAAVLGFACADDEPSPRERCADEGIGECCDDSECAGGSLCDFDYICSPGPDGVSCSEPSGDRLCHLRCDAADEGQACPDDAGTCTRIERFQGGDAGQEAFVCR
ncbi:MAG: hypothetical protein KC486_16920 [Myxococcales bacterium]|nr:hypothetical protein [Myxococcales bacterium]